ncbi:MAG: hypothetical protein H5T74_11335 [Actinobacteria bacterium]|nr:hypothetical protein [Actinomycetota bacterium]MDI6831645.1 hypothetical protein [Actinomycetota bacterium]
MFASFKGCPACGVPRRIAFVHRWREDGILESRMGAARAIMIERDAFAGVLERIEEALGIPIDHILIDAKRRDAKLYVDDVLAGFAGRVVRMGPLRRLGYLVMIRQAATIGLAKAQLLAYRTGKRFIGRALPVYHPVLFVGDVCGAFESLERKRARPVYGNIGEAWYCELYVDESLPVEERLELEKTPEVPAQAGHERCARCGVPRGIGDFRWDLEQGKIIDRRTGEWVIYINVEGVNSVLRELEREIGEEIPRLVHEFTADFYSRLASEHPGSFLSDLAFMKLRGFGVPEREDPGEEELRSGILVRNAFNAPMVAGMVAAAYRGEGRRFTWEVPEKGTVLVRLEVSS